MARSLLALLLPLLLACQAGGELLMVYSVQRHGARNVLPKTATLKESDAAGGPTLLPEGQLQAYKVGVAYRERYMNPEGCGRNASLTGATCLEAELAEPGPEYGVVGSPDGLFNNFNTMVRSSSLDRTIMTARSFLDGAFPPINQPTATKYLPDGQQVVPVYALPEDGSGALIRSYTMCPAYDARLTDWYASDEFKAKEAETKPLRDTIAAAAPGLDTSLKNWWNVYDGFNVFRTYGVGTPMPTIPDATFDEMQQVAYWLETAKMRSELTGNLLGGLVLADLVRYLDAAEAATASNDVELIYYKMLHLSGHYNTQLGLLGALQIDQDPATANFTWFKKIPSLAAVMAFELHSDPSTRPADLAVRLVMQDGVIENLDEVAAVLQRRYPTARVQIVSFGKHPELTMAEQIQLMSETSILISPCGGLATVLTFMRPGATAIVMNFWHTHLNRSVMMEDQFYTNLEYLDLQYFPVNLEDYQGTSDRPECELVPGGMRRHDSRYDQSGALVNCNLWLGKQGMARMQNYVDQAMLRWAARFGRFDVLEPLRQQRAAELQAQGLPLPPAHLEAAAEVARAAGTAGVADRAAVEREHHAMLADPTTGRTAAAKGQAAAALAAPQEGATEQPEQPEQGQEGWRRRGHKVQRRGKALVGGGQGSGPVTDEEQ